MLLCEGFSPFNVDVLYGCTECSRHRTRSQAWRLWKTKIDLEALRFAWHLSRFLSLNHGFSLGHYLTGFMGSHLSLTNLHCMGQVWNIYMLQTNKSVFVRNTFGGSSSLDLNMYAPRPDKQGWTQSMDGIAFLVTSETAELPKIQGLDLPSVGTAPY